MLPFGEISGVAGSGGYEYQKLVAIYYLLVQNSREIEYEVDGEDIAIINEDPNRLSVEYIQCKYLSTGSFSLSKFSNEVFPQLWNAFNEQYRTHPDKAIYSTLFTSVTWDISLKKFCENCKKIRDSGFSALDFEKSIPHSDIRIYQSMRKNKDPDLYWRFLWGIDVTYGQSQELIERNIIDFLRQCDVKAPREKIAQIKEFISKKGQGTITKRQIEQLIDCDLNPREENQISFDYDTVQIGKLMSSLNEASSKFGYNGNIDDEVELFRERYFPVESVAKTLIKYCDFKKQNDQVAFENIERASQIIISDQQGSFDEAKEIANLKVQLKSREKRYSDRIISIKKTAKSIGFWDGE